MGARQAALADRFLAFARENWIVIGGLVAASWTIFQFVDSRKIPFNVSINLTTDVNQESKRDLQAAADAKRALPIIFKVDLENKSDWRELAIRNPIWIAYGVRLGAPLNQSGKQVANVNPEEIRTRINKSFASDGDLRFSADAAGDRRLRDYSYTKDLIGAGTLIGESKIMPKEIIRSQHVLPVVSGLFDFVQIRVFVPTMTQEKNASLYDARMIILDAQGGYEPQVVFCLKVMGECRLLTAKDRPPPGGQIHASASEIWLGKPSQS